MVMKIFFSYAHEDQLLLNKLKAHLMPLQRQELIEMWHDQNISAGTHWKQEVSEHLNSAQIILLLISSHFISSDYCYSVELKQSEYWTEIDMKEPQRDHFYRNYAQHFAIPGVITNVDPSFDITLFNPTSKPIILTHVGVEIVSVAYRLFIAGIPRAVKVKMADSYTIHMPNIWERLPKLSPEEEFFGEGLLPVYLHEVISTPAPDPIYLQAKAPYRYTLLLDHYRGHVPNETILRMWLQTHQGQERSHEILVHT